MSPCHIFLVFVSYFGEMHKMAILLDSGPGNLAIAVTYSLKTFIYFPPQR